MTLRELTGEITYRALSDVPVGLPLTMRVLRENIARHGLPYVDGGLAFRPERLLMPSGDLRVATAAIAALRVEAAERGLPPDVVDIHLPVESTCASEIVTLSQEGVAFLDSVVGTGPEVNALNGLGVLARRIGGGQAEAVMLGQPIHLATPRIVGVRLSGALAQGVTGADAGRALARTLTGVKDAFLEFHGPGASALPVPERMALAAVVPGLFPIDGKVMDYLRAKGFPAAHVELTEQYCKAQGLFDVQATYAELLTLDLSTVRSVPEGPVQAYHRAETILPELHPAHRPRDVIGARVLMMLGDNAVADIERLRNELKAHPVGDVPLALVAGKGYGGGGDAGNDWAGRATRQLGISFVLAEDFAGTHKADLISAGVLPLQAKADLHGDETLTVTGVTNVQPGQRIAVGIAGRDGSRRKLEAVVRIDNRLELEYFRHGGVLPYVLDQLLEAPR